MTHLGRKEGLLSGETEAEMARWRIRIGIRKGQWRERWMVEPMISRPHPGNFSVSWHSLQGR